MKCSECGFVPECRHAFGEFWTDKSGGGVGCSHPFRPSWRMKDLCAAPVAEQSVMPTMRTAARPKAVPLEVALSRGRKRMSQEELSLRILKLKY